MNRKLISFLGTGKYQSCQYAYIHNGIKKKSKQTRFAQTAIYELLTNEGIEFDEVILIVTDEALKRNWNDHEWVNYDGTYTFTTGLDNTWKQLFPDSHYKLRKEMISGGQDEKALWQLFSRVEGLINKNDEIYLDITHSFRSISAVTLIISNYVRLVKGAKIKRLLYGNYEHRNENGEKEPTVVDMTQMLELFDWTNAVDAFLRTGNATMINQLAEINTQNKTDDVQAKLLIELSEQLQNAGLGIETCRGDTMEDDVIKVKKLTSTITENKIDLPKPFSVLVGEIEKKYAKFNPDKSIMNIPELVSWCIEHHLYQQGYTILYEGVLTAICRLADWNIMKEEHRKRALRVVKGLLNPERKQELNDSKEEGAVVKKILKLITLFTKMNVDLSFYSELENKRHSLNHNAMNKKNKFSAIEISNSLDEYLRQSRPFFNTVQNLILNKELENHTR